MAQDTTVLIKSNGWKFKLALGLGGLVVIVILATLYRFEFGIVTLVIGMAYAVKVGLSARHQYKLSQYEQRRIEAETKRTEAEAVHAKAQSFFIETNTGVFVLDGIVIASFYPAVSASKTLADAPMLLPETTTPKYRKLLDVDFIHMLITGATNTGKTTIANWLIDSASPNTVCYVIDAHAKFSRWPGRVSKIVGNGRNYGEIDGMLVSLLSELDKRYNGNDTIFQPILIVIDEWLSVLENCKNAESFFSTIGSEARKVQMHLIITSISATVDDLKCSAAVRDNLAQLTLSRGLKEQNLGELKWSRGNTELVELPGRYVYREAIPASVTPAIEELPTPFELDSGPVAYMPSSEEWRIYELYQAGKSLLAIFKEVYPDKTYGGNQAGELKAVLSKFNVNL